MANLDDQFFIAAPIGTPFPIWNIEYDGDGRAVYLGKAIRGSADSAPRWVIERITYDDNGNALTGRLSPQNSIWDNRASLTYE